MDESEFTNIDVLYPRNQKINKSIAWMDIVSDKIEELKSNKRTSVKMIDFLIEAEVPGLYPNEQVELDTEIDLRNYILKKDEKGNDELDSGSNNEFLLGLFEYQKPKHFEKIDNLQQVSFGLTSDNRAGMYMADLVFIKEGSGEKTNLITKEISFLVDDGADPVSFDVSLKSKDSSSEHHKFTILVNRGEGTASVSNYEYETQDGSFEKADEENWHAKVVFEDRSSYLTLQLLDVYKASLSFSLPENVTLVESEDEFFVDEFISEDEDEEMLQKSPEDHFNKEFEMFDLTDKQKIVKKSQRYVNLFFDIYDAKDENSNIKNKEELAKVTEDLRETITGQVRSKFRKIDDDEDTDSDTDEDIDEDDNDTDSNDDSRTKRRPIIHDEDDNEDATLGLNILLANDDDDDDDKPETTDAKEREFRESRLEAIDKNEKSKISEIAERMFNVAIAYAMLLSPPAEFESLVKEDMNDDDENNVLRTLATEVERIKKKEIVMTEKQFKDFVELVDEVLTVVTLRDGSDEDVIDVFDKEYEKEEESSLFCQVGKGDIDCNHVDFLIKLFSIFFPKDELSITMRGIRRRHKFFREARHMLDQQTFQYEPGPKKGNSDEKLDDEYFALNGPVTIFGAYIPGTVFDQGHLFYTLESEKTDGKDVAGNLYKNFTTHMKENREKLEDDAKGALAMFDLLIMKNNGILQILRHYKEDAVLLLASRVAVKMRSNRMFFFKFVAALTRVGASFALENKDEKEKEKRHGIIACSLKQMDVIEKKITLETNLKLTNLITTLLKPLKNNNVLDFISLKGLLKQEKEKFQIEHFLLFVKPQQLDVSIRRMNANRLIFLQDFFENIVDADEFGEFVEDFVYKKIDRTIQKLLESFFDDFLSNENKITFDKDFKRSIIDEFDKEGLKDYIVDKKNVNLGKQFLSIFMMTLKRKITAKNLPKISVENKDYIKNYLYQDLQDFLIMPPIESLEEDELISIYDHFKKLDTQIKIKGGLVEIVQDPKLGMKLVFNNVGRTSRLAEFLLQSNKGKSKVKGSFLHCVYYFIQSLYDTCHKATFIDNCYDADGGGSENISKFAEQYNTLYFEKHASITTDALNVYYMLHKYDQVKQNVKNVSQYIGDSLTYIRIKPKDFDSKKFKTFTDIIKSDELVNTARTLIGKTPKDIKNGINKLSKKAKQKFEIFKKKNGKYIFTNEKIEENYDELITVKTIKKYLPKSYDAETDILLERNSDLYFQESSTELQIVRFLLIYLSNSDLGIASMSTAHIFNQKGDQYGMFQYVPYEEGKNKLFQPLPLTSTTEGSKSRRTQLDSKDMTNDLISYVNNSVSPNRKIVDYYVALYVEEVKNKGKGTLSLVDQVLSDLKNENGIWKKKFVALGFAFDIGQIQKLLGYLSAEKREKMNFNQVVSAVSSLLIRGMKTKNKNLTVEDEDVDFKLGVGKENEYSIERAATMNFSGQNKKLLLRKSVQNFVNDLFNNCETQ